MPTRDTSTTGTPVRKPAPKRTQPKPKTDKDTVKITSKEVLELANMLEEEQFEILVNNVLLKHIPSEFPHLFRNIIEHQYENKTSVVAELFSAFTQDNSL